MVTPLTKVRRNIILIYLIVGVAGVVYTAAIHVFGRGIPCMIRETTGYMCPGCGSSRMMLAIMRGDLAQAFSYNGVAMISFGVWIVISILVFVGKPEWMRDSRFLLGMLYVTAGVYAAFGILRNLI